MKPRIKYSIQLIIAVALTFSAILLLKQDFLPFMKWWMTILLLGLFFLPFTKILFSQFHDNGYLFSKVIGIAVSGYFMWLFSSIRLMKFSQNSCLFVVLICLIANVVIFLKNKKENEHTKITLLQKKMSSMVTEELLFFAVFLIWIYIRGFKPEAYGTEKFMDYGFMTSMMRSDYMPPQDFWFSGTNLNYYYIGQFMATFLTKLSFVSVNFGYNLMLMTLAAFSFVLPYCLVYNITDHYFKERFITSRKGPVFAGILSAAGVSIAGNMHFPLYYWIVPLVHKLMGNEGEYPKYWFPNSTRYIGYDPETADKTIHEFPSYSFVLGDLHAHVINIIFVLTLLALLFAWLLYRKHRTKHHMALIIKDNSQLVKELYNPYIILIGFFIGLFHTTNYWDFPIYYVVSGAIILFSNAVVYRFKLQTIWITALQGLIIMAVAKLIALPFTLNFDQIATDIYLTLDHTSFYQLFILWGLPSILILGLLLELIIDLRTKLKIEKEKAKEEMSLESNPRKLVKHNKFQRFFMNLSMADLFVLTIGLCAMGLVLIPEIVYVKDIYSGDYKRANTMFKLTYQAFIMFGIATGFIFVKFLKNKKSHWQRIFAGITLLLFLSSIWYTKVAVFAWYGNIFNQKSFKGLNAAAYIETQIPDDYLATEWLNENTQGMPVVLEANGDSYTDYERVSVITGLPTVVGWYVHEWLWKGSDQLVDDRALDVLTIYSSTDKEEVMELIDKYRIEYIYVGKLEYEKYEHLNHNLIKSLGKVVFISPSSSDKEYETYIVHIEPKG